MNSTGALAIFGLIASASWAAADPCMGPTFTTPVPGATSVVTRQVDVPSAQFPGFWQEGVFDQLYYRVFANGEGDIRPNPNTQEWQITFQCNLSVDECTQTVTGKPPDDAFIVAESLKGCLLGLPATPADAEEAPSVEATPQPVADLPCGLALLPQGTDEVTVQKLLVMAGGDPGPVDGIVGPQSLRALVEVLGSNAIELSLAEVKVALDVLLCASVE